MKTTCCSLLTSPVVVKFELPKESKKNMCSSKIMIGNIIRASYVYQKGLKLCSGRTWQNCFSYIGNNTLILTCSSDLVHGFTMIVV